jgi:type II secretory pathway pseudopilin PulG
MRARRGFTNLPRAHRGFTYLAVLFIIAFMGAGSMAIGTLWHTAAVRDREVELLDIGNAYRRAIERYYVAGQRQYPRTLDALVKDPRQPTTQRYIRRLYPDPMTSDGEWGIVKAPDGGIMGVHSKSEEEPRKKANFLLRDRDFQAAKTYADWKFVYTPALQTGAKPPAATAPGAQPAASPAPAAPPAPSPSPSVPPPGAK